MGGRIRGWRVSTELRSLRYFVDDYNYCTQMLPFKNSLGKNQYKMCIEKLQSRYSDLYERSAVLKAHPHAVSSSPSSSLPRGNIVRIPFFQHVTAVTASFVSGTQLLLCQRLAVSGCALHKYYFRRLTLHPGRGMIGVAVAALLALAALSTTAHVKSTALLQAKQPGSAVADIIESPIP
eukprot:3560459-Rhodomonas_salina.2